MGNLNRLGDGEPVDQDFLNDIVDGVNNLSDIVWADQGALIWNGQTDGFNNIAKFRIASGVGSAKFDGKGYYTKANFSYGGLRFSQSPTIFIQTRCTRHATSTITKQDGSTCEVYFHISDGGRQPKSGATVAFNWLAFGPTT